MSGPPVTIRGVVAVDGRLRGLRGVINVAGQPADRRETQPSVRLDVPSESDEALYARLAPELIRFATTLVGPGSAEDLLGTVVLRAISSDGWADVLNKRAYLYRMLVNEAHKSRRSTQRRISREQRAATRDDINAEPLGPELIAALRKLSVRQRAVIYLAYWLDQPPPEIASIIGTSLRTVERELTNARTALEALLS